MMSGGTLFEELGYYYVGPVDGHDMDNLVPILENIRDKKDDKPVSQKLLGACFCSAVAVGACLATTTCLL